VRREVLSSDVNNVCYSVTLKSSVLFLPFLREGTYGWEGRSSFEHFEDVCSCTSSSSFRFFDGEE